MITRIKQRFVDELPLWRLSLRQLFLFLLWSVWPWLCQWMLPDQTALAFGPVIVFLPFAYVVGGLFTTLLPGFAHAYALGMSSTIFVLAYLGLVSWRQVGARRRP